MEVELLLNVKEDMQILGESFWQLYVVQKCSIIINLEGTQLFFLTISHCQVSFSKT